MNSDISAGESCLRASDCLAKIASSASLEAADLIKSTLLRKYLATFSQVLNLGQHQLEWLANHLGHDVTVHRQYYRYAMPQCPIFTCNQKPVGACSRHECESQDLYQDFLVLDRPVSRSHG